MPFDIEVARRMQKEKRDFQVIPNWCGKHSGTSLKKPGAQPQTLAGLIAAASPIAAAPAAVTSSAIAAVTSSAIAAGPGMIVPGVIAVAATEIPASEIAARGAITSTPAAACNHQGDRDGEDHE
jgi:hypothetical protein